jgi:hypothetical protein
MASTRIHSAAGIPLFYDRFSDDSYGKRAVPMRPFVENGFLALLDPCFQAMNENFTRQGLPISQIWSGGVSRNSTKFSYHNLNRAFDLDALVFDDGTKWIAISFPQRPYLYLAIEAHLRMQFGTVLNYDYNADHRDHLHFDNGTSVKFDRMSKSRVTFLQHSLNYIFGASVSADGVWGPGTEAATRAVLQQLGLGTLGDVNNWLSFLTFVSEEALQAEMAIVG